MVLQRTLAVIFGVLVAVATLAWVTGRASGQAIGILAVGFLIVATFYFAVSLLLRLPFQRLRAALASLLAIVLVMLGVLYAVPLIEDYRNGFDVTDSLLHPLVFALLGMGILLLTIRR